MRSALTEFALKDTHELFERVGMGERLAPLVARRLLPVDRAQIAEPPPVSGAPISSTAGPLAIAGTEGLLVSYAHCCYPLPTTRSWRS